MRYGTVFVFINMQNQNIMKTVRLFTAFILASLAVPVMAEDQSTFRKINNQAFKIGEELRYRIHYGFLDAGEATLKVKASDRKVNGRSLIHVEGVGTSISAFDWFFKVRDRYESYLDAEGIFPWIFIRRVHEGGFEINQDYTFMQHKKQVYNGAGQTYEVPDAVQDMLSSFYFARTIDFTNAKDGDIYTIPIFYDNTNYPMKIKFKGRETISVRMGKFRCLKFAPIVEAGRVFKSEEDMTVYITDDQNKIPLLARAKVVVGSIKLEVVEYKNLAGPISQVK
jgi:hypothetical protein